MTKRSCAAVVFALLTVTMPAHAALVETESLDINYPGNLTLTGNLDIQLAAPSVSAYLPQSSTALSVNGTPLEPLVTAGASGEDGYGYMYYLNGGQIAYPTLTFGNPNYGAPLLLTASDIQLHGLIALSGTVTCTANCGGAVSPVPLSTALPLFGIPK